ncbi:hypothetical protein FCH28_12180 [Streptomyces piniterrae]|uniref:Uncharacterized protein n=1 Tax=Streptomyces piniterrae TaxID=2571125 RepID=A0A4U0NQ07_9ACTN|nr:hypothetical protein [Streptomyces piniterrae]TJZ56012.1 hypothetical protein FCH28_12180 [Streptomyces piniterrae]
MPIDVFAALGALVRAEAARTTPKPPAQRSTPESTTPHTDDTTAGSADVPAPAASEETAGSEKTEGGEETGESEEPGASEEPGSDAPPPSTGRKHLLARLFRRLSALFD